MKQEEDTTVIANFSMDKDSQLRHCPKMETDNSILENDDEKTEEYFKKEYEKLEKEDAMIFNNDSWLKSCFEMGEDSEEEHKVPVLIKIKKELETNEDRMEVDSASISKECKTLSKSTPVDHKKSAVTKDCTKEKFKKQKLTTQQKPVLTKSDISKRNYTRNNTKTKEQNKSLALNEAPVSENICSGKCIFKCTECPNSSFSSWASLREHMKKMHKQNAKMSEHKLFASKIVDHVCKVCSAKILCDSNFLQIHLYKHKLSIAEYKKKYNCESFRNINKQKILQKGTLSKQKIDNMCTFRCSKCYKLLKSYASLQKHSYREKCQVNDSDLSNCIQNVVTHQCKICSKVLLCDRVLIERHVIYHGMSLKEYSQNTG